MAPPQETLVSLLARTVQHRGNTCALRSISDTGPVTLLWQEYVDRACRVAAGLYGLGVKRGDHVILLMRNTIEFYLADIACVLIGAIPVSLYLSPDVGSLAIAIKDCEPVLCIAENANFAARARAAIQQAGAFTRLLVVDSDAAADDTIEFATLDGAHTIDLLEAADAVRPTDTATMLFTSGTTGRPKGVPLSHANLAFASWTLAARIGLPMAGWRQLSYLPMAHIGERLATHYLHIRAGSTVTCCPDLSRLPDTLAATSPHLMFGAPRMWERLYSAVNAKLAAGFDAHAALNHAGLGDIRVAIVGSAPLPRHIHQFWVDLGIPLADCYGQTETCGVGTWDPHHIEVGCYGVPFDGTEISFTTGGEILLRGPSVFGGYFRNRKATAKALTADGWYHTGDLGRLDDRGQLILSGRLGDIITPTSGHNVNPVALETLLTRVPMVAHAVVVGHGRRHLAALLALEPDLARNWAAAHGRADSSVATLASDSELQSKIATAIADINEGLPNVERIRRHLIVSDEWPLASDLVTATGKVRRAAVVARYVEQIDAVYGDAAGAGS